MKLLLLSKFCSSRVYIQFPLITGCVCQLSLLNKKMLNIFAMHNSPPLLSKQAAINRQSNTERGLGRAIKDV